MYEELVKTLRLRAALWEKMHDEDSVLKQAADAIEELSREYESVSESLCESIELVQKIKTRENRWIPVTERLPNGEALALNALKGSYGYHEYLVGYVCENCESDSGYSCESEGEILMNVTHWMPLQEPPKEET